MIQLMRVLLNKELRDGKITEDEYKGIMEKMQTNVDDIIKSCHREREEEDEVCWFSIFEIYKN